MRSRTIVFALAASMAVLSGCGADDNSADGGSGGGEARDVNLVAVEYSFTAEESITIAAGDTIRFRVRNEGQLDHQLEVLSAESRQLGITERITPGASSDVTVTFEQPGVYRVICDIDDHQSRGQVAEFTVS